MTFFRLCICAVAVCLLLPSTPAAPQSNISKHDQNLTRHLQKRSAVKVNFNLAKSYGNLDASSLKKLDDSLIAMIGGIVELDLTKAHTWDQLLTILKSSPYMYLDKKRTVRKNNIKSFFDQKILGIGSDKSKRKHYIKSWFTNLIGDTDILKHTNIKLDKIIDLAANTAVGMWSNLLSSDSRQIVLMDAGILRFPDLTQPFFVVYHIKLVGWTRHHTYIFHQNEESHVYGEFLKDVFLPNEDYIDTLTEDVMDDVMSEAESLFDDF